MMKKPPPHRIAKSTDETFSHRFGGFATALQPRKLYIRKFRWGKNSSEKEDRVIWRGDNDDEMQDRLTRINYAEIVHAYMAALLEDPKSRKKFLEIIDQYCITRGTDEEMIEAILRFIANDIP